MMIYVSLPEGLRNSLLGRKIIAHPKADNVELVFAEKDKNEGLRSEIRGVSINGWCFFHGESF